MHYSFVTSAVCPFACIFHLSLVVCARTYTLHTTHYTLYAIRYTHHVLIKRFGMRGVIAEAHYDGQRNFVVMVRGRKRYVLLPPSECPKLSLIPRPHPSARHSDLDWSDPAILSPGARNAKGEPIVLGDALATEVMLSRGEALYIPSHWFHYIVSQDASIQCNARSGHSELEKAVIKRCGFYQSAPAEMAARDVQQRIKEEPLDPVKRKRQKVTGDPQWTFE